MKKSKETHLVLAGVATLISGLAVALWHALTNIVPYGLWEIDGIALIVLLAVILLALIHGVYGLGHRHGSEERWAE